ncbi:hypothetical protein RS84_01975 [Microbacterium hydrocarbonoxydans]|uniref:DUF4064 domain-containing protein n=1 Tax=Microbacterium hydrocarbonoxydans TaxID=273678 RepID=A0A0M2HKF7_9MICO|nr:hypothetical protein [Microbacterium hydrocarbonoxydans]KJL47186.1 hypothetical protein RS84_01975 [Microbacterium hydrocarbonoxydans]
MTAAATTKTDAVVAFRRRAELVIAGIGLAGSAVLQGGFALVIARSDDAALQATILPALRSAGLELDGARAHVVLNTLAAWFGFSFIVVALCTAIGFFFARLRPRRRATGWWFLAAGLACLFGTQFVLYPVAFFFLLSAALFAVRTPTPRSSS